MQTSKIIIGAALAVSLVATVSWLQGRFDRSDHEKAQRLVATYVPKRGGKTIPQVIAEQHPPVKPEELLWKSELLNSCLGNVRIYISLPDTFNPLNADEKVYAFDVRLSDFSIHPTDEKTIATLSALTSTVSSRPSVHLTPTGHNQE